MKRFIKPGLLPHSIEIPTSKSYANRALILAAIKQSLTTLKNLPESTDVQFLLEALKKIGLDIHQDNNVVTIKNSFPECEKDQIPSIEIGEGGTTARFLASLLCLGSNEYTLILGERLKQRPWKEFTQLVQKLGGSAQLEGERLTIKGPISFPENLEIDCSETTQFASGFQLVSAFTDTIIIPLNLKSSQSYWEMTKKMIQSFRDVSEYAIPLDWSSASYALAFGALNQEISFPHLSYDFFQADAKFYLVLKSLGIITDLENGILLKPLKIEKSFDLDVSDCLDLVPSLAFYLCHIEGVHHLWNVQNLIHKESNRLEEVIKLLGHFGKKAFYQEGNLVIEGNPSRVKDEIHLSLPDDHRMVMTASLFLLHHSGGSLSPEEAVNKSYPQFFSLIQ